MQGCWPGPSTGHWGHRGLPALLQSQRSSSLAAKGCLCPRSPKQSQAGGSARQQHLEHQFPKPLTGSTATGVVPGCPKSLQPAAACLCQDKGQAPHRHAADLHIVSPTQCATAKISQSRAAGELQGGGQLPPPAGIPQPGQRKPHGTGVKCAGSTLLPSDGDSWPCCEGTAAHSQHVHVVAKAGLCPSSAIPSG